MFWKIIRWGGTVVLVLVAVTAVVVSGNKVADEPQPAVQPQAGANFNM